MDRQEDKYNFQQIHFHKNFYHFFLKANFLNK